MEDWTLFLDRDGVLNKRIVGSYVRDWSEFEFLEGVLDALAMLAPKFGRIVVVTNQQGVAKGVMTEEALVELHQKMITAVHQAGGRIDKVYYCPAHQRDNPVCRKPNTGMAMQAKADFPAIDFKRSVMVGDSVSDLEFGLRLDMTTVLLTTKTDINQNKLATIELQLTASVGSLYELATKIETLLP